MGRAGRLRNLFMLKVFSMKVTEEEAFTKRWAGYLSACRQAEAVKKKSEQDRRLYLAAEILLNRSLEVLDMPIERPAVYRRNSYGKPYLLTSEPIYVNWSHSKEYVILALADREVGVDVQEMKTEPKQSLIQRTLQPEELIVYDSAPQEQQKRLFYQYWTVKESYLKALGTGFYTPLDTFYVGMDELCPQIVQRIRERDYSCQLLVMPNKDYAAALCVEGEASLRLHPVTVELL